MRYPLGFVETAAVFSMRTDPEGAALCYLAWKAFVGRMGAAGIFRGGQALQAPDTVSIVRLPEGTCRRQVGPPPDSKEIPGGLVVIEAAGLAAALVWTRKADCAAAGSVETPPRAGDGMT